MAKHKTATHGRSLFILSYLLLGLVLSAPARAQNRPEYTLQINSTGLNVKQATLGHAFMIIKVRTNQGVKEEAFGFYSEREATGVSDLPRLIIGTPGALRSEFDRHPQRFQKVDETIEIPITAEQRRGIYKVVNEWNVHHYELITENCITFVSQVATKIGLPAPSKLSYVTADQYIRALRTNYEQEQERIRREEEARRRAEEEERRRAEEARRIPPGWVPCSCPSAHAPYGKVVSGVLYHPDNLRCPQ